MRIASASRFATLRSSHQVEYLPLRIASASRFATLSKRNSPRSIVLRIASASRFATLGSVAASYGLGLRIASASRFATLPTLIRTSPFCCGLRPLLDLLHSLDAFKRLAIVADCVRFSICYTPASTVATSRRLRIASASRFATLLAVALAATPSLRIASASRFATLKITQDRVIGPVADCVRFSICYTWFSSRSRESWVADCVRFSICYTDWHIASRADVLRIASASRFATLIGAGRKWLLWLRIASASRFATLASVRAKTRQALRIASASRFATLLVVVEDLG